MTGIGSVVLGVVLTVVSLGLFAVAASTLWWMLHAWRDPETLVETGFSREPGEPQLSFSLLVPARHEQAVLELTLEQLRRLDHPDYEVLVIVGHDDPGTAEVARRVAARDPEKVRVVVDHNWPKNKPLGLNTALPHCRGRSPASSTPRTRWTRDCCGSLTVPSAPSGPTWSKAAYSSSISVRPGSACVTAWSTSSTSAAGCTCRNGTASSRWGQHRLRPDRAAS